MRGFTEATPKAAPSLRSGCTPTITSAATPHSAANHPPAAYLNLAGRYNYVAQLVDSFEPTLGATTPLRLQADPYLRTTLRAAAYRAEKSASP
jgi:hypothetical protein